MRNPLPLAAALLLSGCYPWTPPALTPATQPAAHGTGAALGPARFTPAARPIPVTILISIDGFRPDYLDRGVTPTLKRLADHGVRAEMRSTFPSKTAPQHWTLVTGMRPDRHGVVANTMEDARRPGEQFTISVDDPFWWSDAEPIWVSAQKAGIPAATMYWPGSNVGVGGVRARDWPNETAGGMRPRDWQAFSLQMPEENRVRAVVDWLRRPPATRPGLITLYLDSIDTAGHEYGPDAPETNIALAKVDGVIAQLVAGFQELGQRANVVIVSDHGMTAVSRDRLVAFDVLLGAGSYRLLDTGAFATVVPNPGQEARIVGILTKRHPHMTCWTPAQVPARYRYGTHPRVAPVSCMAAKGWQIRRNRAAANRDGGGDHGFDPFDREMHAVFIANGPAFRAGRLPLFENVDVTPLLRTLIGLPADARLDGSDRRFRPVLTGN